MSKSFNESMVISQFKDSWILEKWLGRVHFPLRQWKVSN